MTHQNPCKCPATRAPGAQADDSHKFPAPQIPRDRYTLFWSFLRRAEIRLQPTQTRLTHAYPLPPAPFPRPASTDAAQFYVYFPLLFVWCFFFVGVFACADMFDPSVFDIRMVMGVLVCVALMAYAIFRLFVRK